MPLRVLADLFGMPREDRHLIFDWSNALLGADNPSAGQHADEAMLAMAGMMAYGQEMAADRRAEPREDIISRIANAEAAVIGRASGEESVCPDVKNAGTAVY